MSAELAKDAGLAIAICVWVIREMFAWLRDKDRTSRADYLKLEERFLEEVEKLENSLASLSQKLAEVDVSASALVTALRLYQERDADFHGRLWPSHLKRHEVSEFEMQRIRDSLNQLLLRADLPPLGQTPPFGVPAMSDAIPTPMRNTELSAPVSLVTKKDGK